MKHVKVTYVPDCPECGSEMHQYGRYRDGSATPDNPFGEMMKWWHCDGCGHDSEVVPQSEFDALTDRLTTDLRDGGAE